MNSNEPGSDIEIGAIGTGCGVSCLGALLIVPINLIALSALGTSIQEVQRTGYPAPFEVMAFLLGTVLNVAVGYYTAKASTRSASGNVVVLGVIYVVLGLFGFAVQKPPVSVAGLLVTLLAIPAMLYGASLFKKRQTPPKNPMDDRAERFQAWVNAQASQPQSSPPTETSAGDKPAESDQPSEPADIGDTPGDSPRYPG